MESSTKFRSYLSAVAYRWKLAVGIAILTAACLATVVALLPNKYSATTTILLDPPKIPDKYVSSTVTEDPSERLNTLTQEVLSRTRLSVIMNKLNLYPAIRAKRGEDYAVAYMRKQIQIQIKTPRGGSLSAFTITYSSADRKLVSIVTNQLAQTFIDWNLDERQTLVEGTTAFLNDELDRARSGLQSQETRVRDYRMAHLGEMPDQMEANLQTLGRLQLESQAHTESINRIDQERLMLMQDPVSAAAMIATPAVPTPRQRLHSQIAEARKTVDDYSSRYTDQHPDLVAAKEHLAALEAQYQKMPSDASASPTTPGVGSDISARVRLLDQQRKQQVSEQAQLQQQVRHYQLLVDAVPVRQAEISGLMRDYETAKENYKSLLEKSYSAEMATQLERKQQGERFKILDAAIPPEHPDSPNRPLFYFASVLAALALGFGAAILLEQIDGSIKTEDELRAMIPQGAALIGNIPQIRKLPTATPARLWSSL